MYSKLESESEGLSVVSDSFPPHSKFSQEVNTGRSSLRVGNKDVVLASAYNVGDLGSIPGSGRSPGEGIGNPLQYSCLENPIDRGSS